MRCRGDDLLPHGSSREVFFITNRILKTPRDHFPGLLLLHWLLHQGGGKLKREKKTFSNEAPSVLPDKGESISVQDKGCDLTSNVLLSNPEALQWIWAFANLTLCLELWDKTMGAQVTKSPFTALDTFSHIAANTSYLHNDHVSPQSD